MSEKVEKPKGRTMNEIIIDMEKGSGPASKNQVGRILEEQTELMARRVQKSEMEQIMAESERKKIEEENRLKLAREGQMPPEPQQREAPQEAKNILDAVRIGVEVAKPQKSESGSLGEIVKGMADMFKTGVEVGRGQVQPQQPQQNPLETMKQYNEMFLKPVLDQLNSKDKEMMTMRMTQIENKITAQISPQDYIKQVKESANALGLTGGGKSEIDLKLAEMGQTERLDNRRLEWEEKKWNKEQEAGDRTVGLVKDVLSGPVGRVLERFGNAGADRVRGGSSKNALKPVQVACPNPNCKKPFYADESALSVVCPHCGAVLEKQMSASSPPQTQPPAQPPQTEATQPTETTQPASEQQQPAENQQ